MHNRTISAPAPATARAVAAIFCSHAPGWGYYNVRDLAEGEPKWHRDHKVCQPEIVCDWSGHPDFAHEARPVLAAQPAHMDVLGGKGLSDTGLTADEWDMCAW